MLSQIVASQSRRARERRRALFVQEMRISPGWSILDLGGGDGAFMASITPSLPDGVRVSVADIVRDHLHTAVTRGYSAIQVGEAARLPFRDGAFDVVFANSVIEHAVVPLGEDTYRSARCAFPPGEWLALSWSYQQMFAAEIRRISRRGYFVQTPDRRCPIESHSLMPLVGYLPHELQHVAIWHPSRLWIKRAYPHYNLLSPGQMRELFPDATVHEEWLFGMPRSLVAYHRS